MLSLPVVIRRTIAFLLSFGMTVFLTVGSMCCCINGWCGSSDDSAEHTHARKDAMDHGMDHGMNHDPTHSSTTGNPDTEHECNCLFGSSGTHAMAYHFSALMPNPLTIPASDFNASLSPSTAVLPQSAAPDQPTPPPQLEIS